MLKTKAVGFSVRDQRTLNSPVTRARRGRIMENAVASTSVLSLASPLRHAASLMPFRRAAALTAANSRPKPGIKINSCRASDRKTPVAGKTKFAGCSPPGWRVLAMRGKHCI